MAASPGNGAPVGGMAGLQTEKAAPPAVRDQRVRCFNKRLLGEVMEMCSDFSSALLQSQGQLCPERRDRALQEARWNFDTIVQENVTIDGQPFHEASDSPSGLDIKILEDEFDEVIVGTTTKRKYYPRKILAHVSRTLKAEREMLGDYQPVVNREQIICDLNQLARMSNLTAETSRVSKQLGEIMKSLPAQIETTEGLSQVLSMQPVLQDSRTHKEIFARPLPEEKEKTMDFVTELEITPPGTEATNSMDRICKRKRSQSPENKLYPLRTRSKRKISLHAQTN
ncbi:kinetochore-associated protein NSL1 homolog [Ambystoma mexicanum]|uniref:kinetochore-associated protein NSL1 homolog n=1 Tax=Ambystoma mexicanum TaxID=8296 RepID=UPI0037E85D2E